MNNTSVPILPTLDTALTRWEHHGRPGLPENGFVLSRPPGRARQGVYRADSGAPVFEPEGHLLRMAPSPAGHHLCVQLAERADEDAALGLVDTATGALRLYPELRCGYDPVLWSEDSGTVELVAGRSRLLVSLGVDTGRYSSSALPTDARHRLFPGGTNGLLAESGPGRTRLLDRATRAEIGAFPAIARIVHLDDGVLVDDTRGLHALDPYSGDPRWHWTDPDLRITSFAARGKEVVVVGVRGGRSVLVRLVRGESRAEHDVTYRGGPAVATGVSADDSGFHVLVEGPTLPPRVVRVRELLTDGPTGSRGNALARGNARAPGDTLARTERFAVTADDGVRVPVVITSPVGAEGPTPLILTCYGGFGVPSLPVFEPTVPAWIEHGGRYAVAQVRGGGEHGTAWRQAGRGRDKARGIGDLAAVARGLAEAGLTRPESLVLVGASHGGVLVSSCAFGAPDLCAGVVSTAASLDLLRLRSHPLGARWTGEFGDPDDPEDRECLRRISPLERARALTPGGPLPRFLGIVPAEDSRVNADDTLAVAEALRRAGGDATVRRAPRTGHGGNHLDSLHLLGVTVLSFAATTVAPRTGPPTT